MIGNHTPIPFACCGIGRWLVRNLWASSRISTTLVTNAAAAHNGNAAQNIATNLKPHVANNQTKRVNSTSRAAVHAQWLDVPELHHQLQVLV